MKYIIYAMTLLVSSMAHAYTIHNPSSQNPVKALVIAPVIDLVAQSLSKQFPNQSTAESYRSIPICWGPEKKDYAVCPRVHQALFNETVEVIGQNSDEYQVKISTAFYDHQTTGEPQSTYWMLKGNLIELDELYVKKQNRATIPKPISYTSTINSDTQIATLILPFYDPITQLTFSVGTRFIVTPDQVYNQMHTVYVFNPKSGHVVTTDIPKRLCTLSWPTLSKRAAQQNMVQLLRTWTHLSSGVVPLVWGGVSFTQPVVANDFIIQHKAVLGVLLAYWQRSPLLKPPFAGFDASGLICRAAQVYDIPYYFKNSKTAATHLAPLRSYDSIEEGDIIVIPGGILMVSSTQPNNHAVISSCSYSSGYGCVVELKLKDLFENIATFDDLQQAYNARQPLHTKDARGNHLNTYSTFSIHKFSSIWN